MKLPSASGAVAWVATNQLRKLRFETRISNVCFLMPRTLMEASYHPFAQGKQQIYDDGVCANRNSSTLFMVGGLTNKKSNCHKCFVQSKIQGAVVLPRRGIFSHLSTLRSSLDDNNSEVTNTSNILGDEKSGNDSIEEERIHTWKYTPYEPPKIKKPSNQQRRRFSNWTVPSTIHLPDDSYVLSFTRSSGSGGQNGMCPEVKKTLFIFS